LRKVYGYNRSMRAIEVIRVSEVGGREEEDRFGSPDDQRGRMDDLCRREELDVVGVVEEPNVSGGTPLARRRGLRRAVEAVEAGEADVIVFAYFDRFVRSLEVQGEVIRRIAAAGGRLLAADTGLISEETVAEWAKSTMNGFMAEYYRRSIRERSIAGLEQAIKRGHVPGRLIPSLRRAKDGSVELHPKNARHVAKAAKLRRDGATVREVRAYLRRHGIDRSHHAVSKMLQNRQLVGEHVFGEHRIAVPATIDLDTFRAVQRTSVPRGRKAKSERLLARLGILRCAGCGSRMVVSSQNQHGKRYPLYRCPTTGDCVRRMAIGAELLERVVVDKVREALADVEGRASAEQGAREAEAALEHAQAQLDALIELLDPLEPAATKRLAEATEARDAAQEGVDRLGGTRASISISASADWDRLTLDERRALIRATVDRAEVAPGRGAERVTVELVGE
jgi:site-specific DNA recombinase